MYSCKVAVILVRFQRNLDSELCHPRCVFKLYGEVNSVKKHNYKYMAR